MSRTHSTHPPAAAALGQPIAPRDRDQAFRSARRHSRRVRFLRWALPAIALSGLALVALVLSFDPLRLYRGIQTDFGRISITDNKLTIDAPKLSGFTQDRRPYSLTAEQASQDLGKPNLVELAGIHGQVEMANRGETELRARRGLYDMKAGNLTLTEGIEIAATGGYRVTLSDAFVEVKKGRIVTENPVSAVFPDGNLQAARVEIFEHGDRVRFDTVRMTLRMPPEDHEGVQAAQ